MIGGLFGFKGINQKGKRRQGTCLRKTKFWVWESVMRGEGISTPTTPPHNARPKKVPLIKCAKVLWFFKIFIFPKNNNK